jgi:hypothetical protein
MLLSRLPKKRLLRRLRKLSPPNNKELIDSNKRRRVKSKVSPSFLEAIDYFEYTAKVKKSIIFF